MKKKRKRGLGYERKSDEKRERLRDKKTIEIVMDINTLTGIVVDASIKVHTAIGPGCFEKVYEESLYYELFKRKIYIVRQVLMSIKYEELIIPDAYKMDMLLENFLVLELKSVEHLAPVHFKQVMTYLKLSGLKNGLLLNFNVDLMKNGIHRVFNNDGL